MASEARLNVILTLVDRMTNNLKSVNRTLAQNQGLLKKVSIAASAFSIASVLAIRSFSRAAIDSKQAQLSLEAAIAGAGKTFKEFEGPIDKAIDSLTKFSNYSKDEFKRALGDMIIVLGEVPLAIAALGVTADVAARTGTDLGDAALQVSKFMKGEVDSIRGLTGTIGKNITNPLERLAWLQEKVAGSAIAAIDPFKQFGNQVNDTKAIIGKFIVDDLEPLLKKLGELLDIVEKLPPGLLEFGSKVVIIGTGFAALVGALAGLGVAWNVALPVLAAINLWIGGPAGVAILAFAIAITLAAEAWPKFVEEMDKAQKKMEEEPEEPEKKGGFWSTDWWGPFVTWYETSWPKWLKDWDGFVEGWKTFFGTKWEITLPKWLTEPITLPEINFIESWNKFWGGTWFTITLPDWLTKPITLPEIKWPEITLPPSFLTAIDSIKGMWKTAWLNILTDYYEFEIDLTKAWKSFTKSLGNIFRPIINILIGFMESFANTTISGLNAIIAGLNKLPLVDIKPIDFITLPRLVKEVTEGAGGPYGAGAPTRLAQGGIVTSPTLAMIGERGPEAVIPLRKGGGIIINFNGPVYGFEQFEKKIGQAVRDIASRGGFYGVKLGSQ